jgi:hypothetical protein
MLICELSAFFICFIGMLLINLQQLLEPIIGTGVKVKNQAIMKEDYDREPVYYCKRCLSLNIRGVPLVENVDYCGECGATDIGTATIEEWKALYKKKYGKDFVIKRELKWPYWC